MAAFDCFMKMQSSVKEVIDFYKGMGRVIDLWQDDNQNVNAEDSQDNIISLFFIEKGKISPISDEKSIQQRLKLLETEAANMEEDIGDILDNNDAELNNGVKDATSIIWNQVERLHKSVQVRKQKFSKYEEEPLDTQIAAFYNLVRQVLEELLDEVLPAIYRGILITKHPIYELLLSRFNVFLKNIGVFTKKIDIGEKIDLDCCTFAEDESAKQTEKYELEDVIYKVLQYPYMIDNDQLLSPGRACAWRFMKR